MKILVFFFSVFLSSLSLAESTTYQNVNEKDQSATPAADMPSEQGRKKGTKKENSIFDFGAFEDLKGPDRFSAFEGMPLSDDKIPEKEEKEKSEASTSGAESAEGN
jgi:hypothetical protein